MLVSTANRVIANTDEQVNEKIQTEMEDRVLRLATRDLAAVSERLAELDEEWDIERMIEANASTIVLAGVALGTLVDRRWFAIPAAVAGFLLQHALQGWCPPIPILRRLGVRTAGEIADERFALKALRGDFRNLPTGRDEASVRRTIAAVQR